MVSDFWFLINTVRKTKNYLKYWRIGAAYETSGNYDMSIFKTTIWSLLNNENGDI